MADGQRNWFLFMVLFSCLVCSSYSYQFVVGGKDGWVVKPSENYNQWSSRMRFQVNDTLLFKYKSGSDSVLVVNKGDYDSCNVANPLLKLDDGNSVFKFDRSGPFYFISGNKANCDQGQKLTVVVLAIRTPPAGKGGPPGSGTGAPPGHPGGGAPVPAGSPSSTGHPGGGAPVPAGSPSSAGNPGGGVPVPAGSPSSTGGGTGTLVPAGSPLSPGQPGGAPVPAGSPGSPSGAPSPGGSGSGFGPAPASDIPGSPSSSTTPGSPGSSVPGAPGSTTPGSPGSSVPGAPGSSTPGSGTPADANSPPGSLSAPPCSGSVLLMTVLSLGVGTLIFSP